MGAGPRGIVGRGRSSAQCDWGVDSMLMMIRGASSFRSRRVLSRVLQRDGARMRRSSRAKREPKYEPDLKNQTKWNTRESISKHMLPEL